MIGPHGNYQVPLFPLDPHPFPEGFLATCCPGPLTVYDMVTAEALWIACFALLVS